MPTAGGATLEEKAFNEGRESIRISRRPRGTYATENGLSAVCVSLGRRRGGRQEGRITTKAAIARG